MPTFDTPEPISVTIDLAVGDVQISAERPRRHRRRGAPQRRVQRRRTSGPPSRPGSSTPTASCWSRRRSCAAWLSGSTGGSIDVTIELPAGSSVHGDRGAGRLPRRRARSASAGSRPRSATSGSTRPAALNLRTGVGDVTVERATGHAEVTRRLGRRAPPRDRRRRGDQELQRRQLGRRGQRRPAGQGGQRRHRRRPRAAPASTPAPPTATSGSARSSAARSCWRPPIGELEVGIREGTAAWLDVQRQGRAGCTTPSTPPTARDRRRRPSRCARAPPSATSSSAAPTCPSTPPQDDAMTTHQETTTAASRRSRATGLRKSYGDKLVLDGIDLDVAEGTIFALLGPNGAGKTTTVQILSTLIARRRRRGRASPATTWPASPTRCAPRSASPASSRPSTTCSPARRTCILMADLHHLGRAEGRRRAAELLEQFDLVDAAGKPAVDLLRRHAAPARPGDDAWSATRGSSSSTSRPPGSTRAAAARCGRSSATSSPTA